MLQTGSLSAAARLLNISQPSATKHLQHAESTVGYALFRRHAGRLHPTQELMQLALHVSHAPRVQSYSLVAGSLSELEFPKELLEPAELSVAPVVAVVRYPGQAWAAYVVVLVFSAVEGIST